MTKTTQLQIRLTLQEKALIKERARTSGEDVSSWVLRQLLPPIQQQFERLVWQLARGTHRAEALAALHDFLAPLNASQLGQAVAEAPRPDLDAFSANYLAAMVEHGCVRKAIAVPEWVRQIDPLPQPWFASRLVSLRLHLLTRSPAAFRRRNLFVDSTLGDRV